MNIQASKQLETNRAQLSRQETVFVEALMQDPDPERAAVVAGFDPPGPAAWRLLASKQIKKALYDRRQALLENVSAIHAVRELDALITRKETPATVRFSAIKLAIEAAAHTGAKAKQPDANDSDDIDLVNMTNEELEAFSGLIKDAKAEVEARRGKSSPVKQISKPIQI